MAVLETPSDLNTGTSRYIHDACLCYRDTGEIFYEGLGYTYLDLANFVKTEEECVSEMDHWLYWLKHLHETDELPPYLRATIFERLFNIAEYTNLSKEEQAMYDQDLKHKWDNDAAHVNSREEGKAEGRAEGREEGKALGEEKKALEIAAEMKREGYSNETIAKLTKRSIQEIEKL